VGLVLCVEVDLVEAVRDDGHYLLLLVIGTVWRALELDARDVAEVVCGLITLVDQRGLLFLLLVDFFFGYLVFLFPGSHFGFFKVRQHLFTLLIPREPVNSPIGLSVLAAGVEVRFLRLVVTVNVVSFVGLLG